MSFKFCNNVIILYAIKKNIIIKICTCNYISWKIWNRSFWIIRQLNGKLNLASCDYSRTANHIFLLQNNQTLLGFEVLLKYLNVSICVCNCKHVELPWATECYFIFQNILIVLFPLILLLYCSKWWINENYACHFFLIWYFQNVFILTEALDCF